jgi:hypothetical protein
MTADRHTFTRGDTMIEVKDEDHVVVVNSWGNVSVHQAIRVTKAIIFYIDQTWAPKLQERRLRIQDVIFAGPKAIADKLATQLTSSRAQLNHDEYSAKVRQEKRDDDFIAAAMSALASQERK